MSKNIKFDLELEVRQLRKEVDKLCQYQTAFDALLSIAQMKHYIQTHNLYSYCEGIPEDLIEEYQISSYPQIWQMLYKVKTIQDEKKNT